MRQIYGRGQNRNKRDGSMGKLEKRYVAEVLDPQKLSGEVLEWAFEPENLRLADRTFYVPDFRVVKNDGTIEFHEVKGMWEAKARVKIKVAAELHPYRFVAVMVKRKRDGGGWSVEEF
jgi:hypothetical protein